MQAKRNKLRQYITTLDNARQKYLTKTVCLYILLARHSYC